MTLFGNDVKFTFDDATLFGTGYTVGNGVFFMPTAFIAESNNTDGLVTVVETLSIVVEATTTGKTMTQFALAEQGDYLLNGTSTSVSATGTFGAGSNTSAFSDSKALSAGALTVQGALTEWQINSLIDLADTAGWGQDTGVTLTLENTSTAESTVLGDQALIQKKFGAFGVQVTIVPVPAAVYLFGSALAVLGWRRRRH
ncbi:MAG: hypothetical protein ACE5G3_09840 [Gammaproteobacteria bacterium]